MTDADVLGPSRIVEVACNIGTRMGSRSNQWLLGLALGLVLSSCQKTTDMARDPLIGSARPAVPAVDVGAGLVPTEFVPGRYATAIQRTHHGTHALQVLNEDSTSLFALELGADGSATACRVWRYLFRNDGPEVQTEDRYREQQGYRGRYTVVDGVAEVVLTTDDAVCPRVFEGALALARASTVTLRCVRAAPSKTSPLPTPVLLCQAAATLSELEPYAVEQLAPPGWFALGSGHGLRVWVTGRPPGAQEGDDVNATAKVADPPLPPDAWERAF